jgi:hypothetical protein
VLGADIVNCNHIEECSTNYETQRSCYWLATILIPTVVVENLLRANTKFHKRYVANESKKKHSVNFR